MFTCECVRVLWRPISKAWNYSDLSVSGNWSKFQHNIKIFTYKKLLRTNLRKFEEIVSLYSNLPISYCFIFSPSTGKLKSIVDLVVKPLSLLSNYKTNIYHITEHTGDFVPVQTNSPWRQDFNALTQTVGTISVKMAVGTPRLQ